MSIIRPSHTVRYFLIKKKVQSFKTVDKLKAACIYPFFRPLQSDQDTEVMIGSKPVLMFGSNSYLGLTNHPQVKEAAKKAIDALRDVIKYIGKLF